MYLRQCLVQSVGIEVLIIYVLMGNLASSLDASTNHKKYCTRHFRNALIITLQNIDILFESTEWNIILRLCLMFG